MLLSHLRDIDERVMDRSHSGADAECVHSAFERGNTFFENRVGWISDSRVDVSLNFQIE